MSRSKSFAPYAFMLLPFSACAEQLDYFALSIEQLLEIEVNSASGVTEQLTETPTPVSVITEQMIKQSGVNSLRDLLTLYIPNFTQVQDHNEYNVAFRGVYTSSQQKFLVLLNGHRLNSRAYAMASPDLSIALEKIKHIEVLRGPGSSVHGNAALTSVINIVAKSGAELEGARMSAEVGNHGYREVFAEAGMQDEGINWYAWFKYAESKGEKWTISPEQDYASHPASTDQISYLDRFTDEPSFDYGLSLSTDSNWQMLLNYRQSHYSEPLTTGGSSGAAYDLNMVPLVDGVSPGAQSEWFHSYLTKSWQLDDAQQFKFKLYYDTNYTLGVIANQGEQLSFSTIAWDDRDVGFSGNWQYQGEDMTLLVGVDFDHMKVTDSKAYFGSMGKIGGELTFNGHGLLPRGSESIWSSYIQLKQSLDEHWLLNAGLRYDHKNRRIGHSITEVSPRLALIRQSDEHVFKLSYAKSFVDPPYWNRYSSLSTFRGASDLEPEMLESLQVSPEFYLFDKSLQFKLNLYYNEYTNVVFRRVTAERNEALFTNAGAIKTAGLEQEISYHLDNKVIRFIGSQNRVVNLHNYPAYDDKVNNIPNYQFTLIFDHEINDRLQYQLSAKYIGERRSPINIALDGEAVSDPFPSSGVVYQDPKYQLGATTLVSANLIWKLENSPMSVSFNVQNAFDKEWYQGGSVAHPYKQTGRWYKLGIEYKFQ